MTILEDARAALDTGPLCDSCLGRPFADRSFGLTNAERGRALRTTLALDEDKPYEPDEDCWVCEMETAEYDRLALERGAAAIQGYEFETYRQGRASRRCWRRTTTCSGRDRPRRRRRRRGAEDRVQSRGRQARG